MPGDSKVRLPAAYPILAHATESGYRGLGAVQLGGYLQTERIFVSEP